MTISFLHATGITDTGANVASGAVTDVDELVSAADAALQVSVSKQWATPFFVEFALDDLPGAAQSINSVILRVRNRIVGTWVDDSIQYAWTIVGTDLAHPTLQWDFQADGGAALANRQQTVTDSPTVANVNAALIRVTQIYNATMSKEAITSDWDCFELEVDWTGGAQTNQEAFRFIDDDGNEANATFTAALNTDITGDRDTLQRLRFQLSNPGATPEPSQTFKIQKSIDGGSYTDLTANGTDVRLVLSGNFADLDVTTERLAGSGTFIAGDMIEGTASELAESGAITIGAVEDTEIEVIFDCFGLKGSQTVEFRVTQTGGALLDNYNQSPIFTVASSAVQTILRTTFPTPTQSLLFGAGKQKFRLHVRRDAANSGTGTPNVDLFLYEGGVLRETLTANISITSDSGQTIEATWDADNLASGDGGGAELRAVGDVAGSGIQARTVEFGAVEWCVEHEAAAAGSFVEQGTLGNLSVTGLVATLIHGQADQQGTLGTLGVAGFAGQFQTNFVAQGTSGTVTIAGFVATINHGQVVQGTSGTVPASGFGGSLIHGWSEQGPPGTVAVTGFAGTVDLGDLSFVGQGTTGTLSVAGLAGTIEAGLVVQGTAGTVTVTGGVSTLSLGLVAQGTAGTVTVAGFVSTLTHGHVLQGTLGTLTATGLAGGIDAGHVLQGTAGSVTVTGFAGEFQTQFVAQGTAGSVTVNGFAGQFQTAFIEQGTAAAVSLTGLAGNSIHGHIIQGTLGTLSVSGFAGTVDLGGDSFTGQGTTGTLSVSGLAGVFCNDLFVPDTIAAKTGVVGVVADIQADDGDWLLSV